LRKRSKSLHDKLLVSIDRRAIAGLLSEIAAEHGPFAGNRTRASLSSFFAWTMKQGLIETNPVIGTDRPADEVERDRVLTDGELHEIWQALPADDYGDIVKLLALTGQRRDEIASLRWSEIDLEERIITLPPARTKNKREHIVPLGVPVVAILKARKRLLDRDLVFGSGRGGF
jgi:integrase